MFVRAVCLSVYLSVCLSVCLHTLLISADIDECSIQTHTCNDAQHYCNNTIGNYTCHCNNGYEQYWKNRAQKCRGKGGRTLHIIPCQSGVPCPENECTGNSYQSTSTHTLNPYVEIHAGQPMQCCARLHVCAKQCRV